MPNQRCEVSDKMGVKCNIIPKNLLLQQSLFTQAIVMCQNITIGVLESLLIIKLNPTSKTQYILLN
jgi:hypothetical protein